MVESEKNEALIDFLETRQTRGTGAKLTVLSTNGEHELDALHRPNSRFPPNCPG